MTHDRDTEPADGDTYVSHSLLNTILTIVSFVATGAIGYFTTTHGNSREDTVTIIWAVLIIACVVVVSLIWKKNSRDTIDSLIESQHAELMKRLDEQDAKLTEQDQKFDQVITAQQQSMRAQLVHSAEKYITRAWITGEELQTWEDLYASYDELPGANGYIAAYKQHLERLDVRGIAAMSSGKENDQNGQEGA